MPLKFKVGSKYSTAVKKLRKRGFTEIDFHTVSRTTDHLFEGRSGERKVIRTDVHNKKVTGVKT